MYLTNDELDGYAMIWTEDETYNTLYLWDESGAICTLTSDWKSEDPMDGIWGFFVSDPTGTCPYVESEGWTYSWYTADEDLNPISVVGPYGNTWYFTSEEDFYGGEVCENDESVADVDGDTCSSYYDANPDGCGNYDTDEFIAARECCVCGGGSTGSYSSGEFSWYMYLTNDEVDGYAMIWSEDPEFNTLYVWDESGAICTLTTDWIDATDPE
jgi:hypothetical protein